MDDPVLVQVLDGASDGADESSGVPNARRVAPERRGQTTAARASAWKRWICSIDAHEPARMSFRATMRSSRV